MQRRRHYIHSIWVAAFAVGLLLSSPSFASTAPAPAGAGAQAIGAGMMQGGMASVYRDLAMQALKDGDTVKAMEYLNQAKAADLNAQQLQQAGQARQSSPGGSGGGKGGSESGKSAMPPPAPAAPPSGGDKKDSGGDSKNQAANAQPSGLPSMSPAAVPSPTEDKAATAASKSAMDELANLKDQTAQVRASTKTTSAAAEGLQQQINSTFANRQRLLDTVSAGSATAKAPAPQPAPAPTAGGGTQTASATVPQTFQDKLKEIEKAKNTGGGTGSGGGLSMRAVAASPQSRLLQSVGGAKEVELPGLTKDGKKKARALRTVQPRLAWGFRAKGALPSNRWVSTHEPPRTLTVALEKNRRNILGSTRRAFNRVAKAKDQIATALRSRGEVLKWGDQPARSREEAPPPPPSSVSVAGEAAAESAGGHSDAQPSARSLFPTLGGVKK